MFYHVCSTLYTACIYALTQTTKFQKQIADNILKGLKLNQALEKGGFMHLCNLLCKARHHTIICKIHFAESKEHSINPLPNDKTLEGSRLKEFADDKVNVTQKWKFVL